MASRLWIRISLALLIITGLLLRARGLTQFTTDNGVLSRAASIAYADSYRTSFYWMSGAEWFQIILLLVALLAATSLMIGYRTRLSAIMS